MPYQVAADNIQKHNVPSQIHTPFRVKHPVFGLVRAPLKSVIVGPSSRDDPLVVVVPSLLKQVINHLPIIPEPCFLRHLTLLDISHGIIIPSFFNDPHLLVHIVFIMIPQLGDNALEKVALDYMEEDEAEAEVDVEGLSTDAEPVEATDNAQNADSDVEVLEVPPPVFKTPQKKYIKVKERLDDGFLRRSGRLAKKTEGYIPRKVPRKQRSQWQILSL